MAPFLFGMTFQTGKIRFHQDVSRGEESLSGCKCSFRLPDGSVLRESGSFLDAMKELNSRIRDSIPEEMVAGTTAIVAGME